MRYVVVIPAALALAGCVATVTPPRVEVVAPPPAVVVAPAEYEPPPPPPVVSVYVEPPIGQPPPIAVGWAPPAMLVDTPPPPPFPDAVWVGGYWVWQGNWVWAHGHWMGPPQPGYGWVHPYYENRDGAVIFIGGHWAAPGVVFVPPPMSLHLSIEVALPGVVAGVRPIGPPGCFVPPPPGSRPGFIVPAPIGTPPAVVTGAPPVVAVGMRINASTTVNNINNSHTTNITNVTNVTIVAPPSAVAGGKAFNSSVPARANLAAAQAPVIHAAAPEPASTKPIPNFVHGAKPPALPAAQTVQVHNTPPAPHQNAGPGSNNGGNAVHPTPNQPQNAANHGAPGTPPNANNQHGNGPNGNPNGSQNSGAHGTHNGANNAPKAAVQNGQHPGGNGSSGNGQQAHNNPQANQKPPLTAQNKSPAKPQNNGEKKPNEKKPAPKKEPPKKDDKHEDGK